MFLFEENTRKIENALLKAGGWVDFSVFCLHVFCFVLPRQEWFMCSPKKVLFSTKEGCCSPLYEKFFVRGFLA